MAMKVSEEEPAGGYLPRYDRDPEVRRAADIAEARGWRQSFLRNEDDELALIERVMSRVVSERVNALRNLIDAETAAQSKLKDVSAAVVRAREELSAVLDTLSLPKDEADNPPPNWGSGGVRP